jgi:hypothetical protein
MSITVVLATALGGGSAVGATETRLGDETQLFRPSGPSPSSFYEDDPLRGPGLGHSREPPLLFDQAAFRPLLAAPRLTLLYAPLPEFEGKRFWLGAAELMAVQGIPLGVNNLRDLEFAKISPQSWKDNLENPWRWDNNQFVNNQFSHPYHGALYYNAARSNGYNFWSASAWPWAGSLMWEYFGEKWAPAPNDVINTSMGGITLGETFWRLSSLMLDNRAHGRERVVREVGASLLNPVRGFTRLVNGDMGRSAENPDEWRPSTLQAALDLGFRQNAATLATGPKSVEQGFIGFSMAYGDVLADVDKSPFSYFMFRAEAARPGDVGLQAKRIALLQSRGSLAGWSLHDGERSHHRIGVFITYDYLNNPAYEFGGQGIAAGWIGAPLETGDVRLTVEALARTYAIAATFSDYFETDEGRNYDYGPGAGASGAMSLSWKGRARIELSGVSNWIETVSGVDGSHHQTLWTADARVYLKGRFGVGGLYRSFHRDSHYDDFPAVQFNSSESRLFVSLALPRFGR